MTRTILMHDPRAHRPPTSPAPTSGAGLGRPKRPVIALHPASAVPLYHQLAQALSTSIDLGDLAPGDVLERPSDLARRLRIATSTVRRAHAALLREAHVRRYRDSSVLVVHRPTR
ncbi:GntR family transcriptional regulator [Rhodococcus qingshengii]|uniref:GntR family transcriptional regulator n=1 Tax=Rhodococcus qingshengii TaxID=334542 RepID=UPI001BEAB60D|nr:GntR family transcriptional regulator [Rhodococcus qingshengii]MBT2273607.1 GntR family transcriptional regulator [Rhodococcus qingshengii]